MNGVTKQKITYKRADGVDLTGDLYLPKGYNKEKDGPLPLLIWLIHVSLTTLLMLHKFVAVKTGLQPSVGAVQYFM